MAAPPACMYVGGWVGGRIDAVDIEPQLTHTTWRPLIASCRHQSACQLVVQRGMILLLYCPACYMCFVLQHTRGRKEMIAFDWPREVPTPHVSRS